MQCLKDCFEKLKEKSKSSEEFDYETLRDEDHLNYFCVDKPYGLESLELLIQIRFCIESSKNSMEKIYFKILEDYITILDYLCHANSRQVLSQYLTKIEKLKSLENNSNLKYLIKMTSTAVKLGLKSMKTKESIEMNFAKIQKFQIELKNFLTNIEPNQFNFINKYSNILEKLPYLALTRRGINIK